MLRYIQGTIVQHCGGSLIVENNGLGYEIFVSEEVLRSVTSGEGVTFFLYAHIREDSYDLYGFVAYEELQLFERLVSVSGVGPKTALAALSMVPVATMMRAIAHGDASVLRSVPGVGAKTADRLILELRDKMGIEAVMTPEEQGAYQVDNDVVEALVGLGYPVSQARGVVESLSSDVSDTQAKLKLALTQLSQS